MSTTTDVDLLTQHLHDLDQHIEAARREVGASRAAQGALEPRLARAISQEAALGHSLLLGTENPYASAELRDVCAQRDAAQKQEAAALVRLTELSNRRSETLRRLRALGVEA